MAFKKITEILDDRKKKTFWQQVVKKTRQKSQFQFQTYLLKFELKQYTATQEKVEEEYLKVFKTPFKKQIETSTITYFSYQF